MEKFALLQVTDTETVVSGIRMGAFVERLGTSGIFYSDHHVASLLLNFIACVSNVTGSSRCPMLFRQGGISFIYRIDSYFVIAFA